MNELTMITPADTPLTMTSLEIAELLGRRHDNVKRTIETLADKGIFQLPQIEEVKNHKGQRVQVYLCDKRTSMIVVAQLSPEFTAALVDYWSAREAEAAKPQPRIDYRDPVHLLGVMGALQEDIKGLEAENARMRPIARSQPRHEAHDFFS